MKNLLFYILLLFSSFSYAQKNINGMFHRPPEKMSFNSEYLEFKEDARFKYHTYGCMTSHTNGKGTYELKDDEIILNFDEAEIKEHGEIHTEKINSLPHKDSIELRIKVKDKEGMALPGTYLSFIPEETNNKKEYRANFQGEIIITTAKNSGKTKYKLSAIAFQSFQFELPNTSSRNIEVVMSTPQPRAISKETYHYEVEQFYKDSIVLKDGSKFRKIEK